MPGRADAMTCRHKDPINNKECGSYQSPEKQRENLKKDLQRLSAEFGLKDEPDNSDFEILDAVEGTSGLVLKVKYHSCPECSYEGTKILVYFNASIKDALKWRVIDPHFSDKPAETRHAPSPDVRFPASDSGWWRALGYIGAAL
jgi:hypothetical protein